MITRERAKNLEAQVEAQAKLLAVQASALKLAREALASADWNSLDLPEFTQEKVTAALAAIDNLLKGE